MIFDVHAHYFPAKYLDALEGVGKPDIGDLVHSAMRGQNVISSTHVFA